MIPRPGTKLSGLAHIAPWISIFQHKAEGMFSGLIGLQLLMGLNSGGSETDAIIRTIFLATLLNLLLFIVFVLILCRHEQPAAPQSPPPYNFGPSPKVVINGKPSVLTSTIPEKIDNTHLSPPPNPYGPMDGSLQGRASSTQSVPPHSNSTSTLNTQSVPPHEVYHPTHGYPISSPSVSVQSSVGDITSTTITNVGNNNSYRHPQASLHPSVLVNSEGHITNTNTQSIPHHNTYHLATQGGPISNPSVSVQLGVGKITDTTITYVGDNNIYEDSQGTTSNSHPLMSTLDTQSIPYHQPVNGHPISSSSVSVSSGGDITNTAIPNVGNNNYGNPQKNNGSNVQA